MTALASGAFVPAPGTARRGGNGGRSFQIFSREGKPGAGGGACGPASPPHPQPLSPKGRGEQEGYGRPPHISSSANGCAGPRYFFGSTNSPGSSRGFTVNSRYTSVVRERAPSF